MQELGRRGCNEVWVEAGRQLAGALLQAGLVDELLLYLAPKVLGDSALGLLHIAELDSLAQAPQLIWHDVQQIGDDLRLTLRPAVKEK